MSALETETGIATETVIGANGRPGKHGIVTETGTGKPKLRYQLHVHIHALAWLVITLPPLQVPEQSPVRT